MGQKKACMKSTVISFMLLVVMVFAMSVTVAAATPTNVRQTSDSDTSVRIEWMGVAGTGYYGIQAATDAGFANVVFEDYRTSSSSYMYISRLAAGSSYYVRIGCGADRDHCYENWSSPIEVVTTPAKVSTVKFTGATDKKAMIAWNAVSGANRYVVEYNGKKYTTDQNTYALPYASGASSAKVLSERVSSTGYVADTISAYVYDISALTKKIAKKNLGFVNVYPNINVFQIGANYKGHGMDVKVYNAKTGKAAFSGTAKNTSYGSVEFRNKFKYNVMYKYRARAYVTTTDGRKITGDWSSYRYVVNPKKSQYNVGSGKIKLKWSKLTGVTKIKVQVSTKENSGYKTAATLKGTKTSYTLSKYNKKALKKGRNYYVRILYYSGSNLSDYISQSRAIKVR